MFVSKRSLFAVLAGLLLLFPGGLGNAQEVVDEISLHDMQGAIDYAFGMELSPDGEKLYVAVCGTFGDQNNRLVRIDTATDTIDGEGTTGLYPEEIAFRLDGGGEIEKIFVSNSSDGTVSVLNPDLTNDTLIDLTGGGSSTYPFGLIMDPTGRYLFVSTVNVGEIYVVDTDAGPSQYEIIAVHYIASFNGRMAFFGDQLLIPGSDPMDGAVLSIMDITNPWLVDTVVLDGNTGGYPGANDVLVSDDGYAYVPVVDYTFPRSPILYEVDLTLQPPEVSDTIDLSAVGPDLGLEHGIGASQDEHTLAVTYLDDTVIKLVSRKAGCVMSFLDVDPFNPSQLNEAVFSADDEKLYLSSQTAKPVVYVVGDLPGNGLLLEGTANATLNGPVDLILVGGQENQYGLFIMSRTAGESVFPDFTLDLALPFTFPYLGLFDAGNTLSMPSFNVPNMAQLVGKTFYYQGLTQDSDLEYRPSNLHTLQIF